MTRNQKIALGCGGAGCLGLILVVVLVVVLSAAGYMSLPGSTNSNYNYNANSNTNRNSNYNYNSNSNRNSNSSSPSSSSMSTDENHKLFQAAAGTNDTALTRRVWSKIGLLNSDGTPNDQYSDFVRAHITWLFQNRDFVQSINTPEKARAYVDEHIND